MPDLSLQKKARRLRIYVGEQDRWRGSPLDAALVQTLRQNGLAGATVFRGMGGFGAHSLIHSAHIEVLSTDLPVVIESIDTPEKIADVLEVIYPMVREGLITVEDVEIVKYTHRYLNPLPADRLVAEVMTRDVVTLRPEMPVQQGWKTMLAQQVKAAPVVDAARKVVGILTDEDLMERAGVRQRLSVALRLDAAEVNDELRSLADSPLKIQDVMTTPVISVEQGESLGVATARMVKFGLKRLPVVDAAGHLVGVISRLDILRQVAKVAQVARETPAQPVVPPQAGRTVADIMSTDFPMADQDDSLALLIEKFSRSDSHRLIVVNAEGKAIGLISDSDVVMRVQAPRRRGVLDALRHIGKPPPGRETALELMSAGVLMVHPQTPVVDALKKMLDNSRKWMIVVDENDRPLGLVDRQMMLEAIAVVDGRP